MDHIIKFWLTLILTEINFLGASEEEFYANLGNVYGGYYSRHYIMIEYVSGGSLLDLITNKFKHVSPFSEEDALEKMKYVFLSHAPILL